MNCTKCKKQIPDGVAFCAYCGAKQTNSSRLNNGRVQWEYCEILSWSMGGAGLFKGPQMQFYARARGPEGEYNAAVSEVFRVQGSLLRALLDSSGSGSGLALALEPRESNQNASNAYHTLVKRLLNDGWEQTGNKGDWYSDTFRRQASR